MAHYIFLVHGWLGNDSEMDYLSCAIRGITSPPLEKMDENEHNSSTTAGTTHEDSISKRIRKSNSYESRLSAHQCSSMSSENADHDDNKTEVQPPDIVLHSVKCNVGRTHDGIRKGGTRLADEIIEFIRSDVQQRQDRSLVVVGRKSGGEEASSDENRMDDNIINHHHAAAAHVTYSIVGNSLGGLYARYALSLLPYQIPLLPQRPTDVRRMMLHLHPNVFCTTATPHLGVSRHTYLPIPRIAEKLIGTGMGTTGRDLFRLNSDKEPMTGGLRGERARLPSKDDANLNDSGDGNDEKAAEQLKRYDDDDDDDDDEMECIIRNMCLQEKYLSPLRNFHCRIAYANVYGTDFQVPTVTAAFLNERSGVGHFVVASRELPITFPAEGGQQRATLSDKSEQEHEVLPSFIVAVVRTEKQSQRQSSPFKSDGGDATSPSGELLRMSQSLDALGWTKVSSRMKHHCKLQVDDDNIDQIFSYCYLNRMIGKGFH